jgi:hypothetical protein
MMEAESISEESVYLYETTRRYITKAVIFRRNIIWVCKKRFSAEKVLQFFALPGCDQSDVDDRIFMHVK